MTKSKILSPSVFNLPIDQIRQGYYSDTYFNRAKTILEKDNHHPHITQQIFQKQGQVVLCGITEVKALLKYCTGYYKHSSSAKKRWLNQSRQLTIRSLADGDTASAWETVMLIKGDYSLFAPLENLYLGILARRTKIATNTRQVVEAANGKPVLYFSPRFDHFLNQPGDGYAAHLGGAAGVSTDAAASWFNQKGIGTIPHALIVTYAGSTVKTTQKFNQTFKNLNTIALVDFDNHCINTSLAVAKKLGKKLWGVRLDTASNLADISTPKHKGVNPLLVKKLKHALDKAGFNHVKIIVSGGFNPEKITRFEKLKTPVDIYTVGSWIFSGQIDFTADAVQLNGKNLAKVGRKFSPNKRLKSW